MFADAVSCSVSGSTLAAVGVSALEMRQCHTADLLIAREAVLVKLEEPWMGKGTTLLFQRIPINLKFMEWGRGQM